MGTGAKPQKQSCCLVNELLKVRTSGTDRQKPAKSWISCRKFKGGVKPAKAPPAGQMMASRFQVKEFRESNFMKGSSGTADASEGVSSVGK